MPNVWAQILGTIVGAVLGWTAVLLVLFYFLGFPPIHEVAEAVLRALLYVATLGD